MNQKIKTIFMGTPELAASGLKALLQDDAFVIQAVISQADKSSGRNLNIKKTPVKTVAEEYKLLIYQPEKIKEITNQILELKPDLIIVIAYGKILPKEILDIPIYGCINVHASLLPKYRGSACVAAPILNGDKISGLTIMKMDENMDTGDIIKQIEIKLDDNETSISLMDKIKKVSFDNLTSVIKDYINNNLKPIPQDNTKATYVKMIKKEDGHLNFNETAQTIERKIRAYLPWPGSYAFIERELSVKLLFKIQKLEKIFINDPQRIPGEIFINDKALWIKTKDLAIKPEIIQLEGKKALKSNDFLQGNAWVIGKILK